MTILFLSQIVPFPPHGGVLQRGFNLLRHIGRRHHVHLLAFVHPDVLASASLVEQSRHALSTYCEEIEYFPLWAKASRLHRSAALAMGTWSCAPFSVIAHHSAAFQARVASLLRRGFDLVHVDTLALCQFIERLPERRRMPSVLTHHNIESVLMARRAGVESGWLAKTYLTRDSLKLARYEASQAPRFDVNIMVSAHDARLLAERVPGVATRVVPNGVDIEYFTPAPEEETSALIYGGGMNMFANRDAVLYFLTEIWPRIRGQVPGVEFHAVGQDPPRALLEIADRDPRVRVPGYVDDIRPLIRRAAVYVVPLRVGGGTRLKVLDAMAMGKAIVSTTIGAEGIEVRPGEHLVTADTPETFADATVALLADGARRRALGRSARRLVERTYSWSVVGDQLIDTYNHALAVRRIERSHVSADLS